MKAITRLLAVLSIVVLACVSQIAHAGLIHNFTVLSDDRVVDLGGVLEFNQEVSGAFTTDLSLIKSLTLNSGHAFLVPHQEFVFNPALGSFAGTVDPVSWQLTLDPASVLFFDYTGTRDVGPMLVRSNLATMLGDGLLPILFPEDCPRFFVLCNSQTTLSFNHVPQPPTAVPQPPTAVSEPGTLALLAIGLAGMGSARRKKAV